MADLVLGRNFDILNFILNNILIAGVKTISKDKISNLYDNDSLVHEK